MGSAAGAETPVIVFEVLSPTTERNDRIIKVRDYGTVSSLRRYILIDSANAGLTIFSRQVGDVPWEATTLGDPAELLNLPEIAASIPVVELYEDVEFETDTEVSGPV